MSDGRLANYFAEKQEIANRQEADLAYYPNGAIYIFNYEYYRDSQNGYGGRVFPYLMPKDRSVDIDDLFDFRLAEYLMGGK